MAHAAAPDSRSGAQRARFRLSAAAPLLRPLAIDLYCGLGGRPALMYPGAKIEDLIHELGKPIGGNVPV